MSFWHPASILTIALSACNLTDTTETLLIGHGGMGYSDTYPMNTRASVLAAMEAGMDGIELDVQLTADSVLVAYHAQDLSEQTACAGLINSSTWKELRSCAVLSGSGEAYPIVRLDQVLIAAAQAHPGLDITLDCKLFASGDWWPYLMAFSAAIVELNRIPIIQGHLVVECQVDDFLLLLQRDQPYIPLFRYANDMEEATWRAVTSHFAGVVVNNDRVTKDQVKKAQELGLEVTIFGAGDRWGHFKALRKGPDRLQTDAPLLFSNSATGTSDTPGASIFAVR